MSTSPDHRDDRPRDPIRKAYRWLLRLYPTLFRARFGRDLMDAFDDRRGEPRFQGILGGIHLVGFLLGDFVTSVPLTRDTARRERMGTIMMHRIGQDLKYAYRMLVKNPVFTAAAVLTLALGIGLNAATFSAVHGILLRPLPGADRPDRLVQLYRAWPGMEYGSNSIPHYQDLRDRTSDVFSDVAAWSFAQLSLSVDDRSDRIMGMLVSANFFQTYGAQPAIGRAFIPGEESEGAGAHPVIVLGHSFWQTRFGGDPTIVGRSVVMNGSPFEVVGVAPREFKGPVSFADTPIYVPLMMQGVIEPLDNTIEERGQNSFNVVGRLYDEVELPRAEQTLDAVLAQLKDELPDSYDTQMGTTTVLQSEAGFHPELRGAQVGMSGVMMAVVSLLLLIACVNVANLFLARARERRREIGVRLSIGAGRGRIVQQLLTESLVFASIAGLAGLGLAQVAVGFLSKVKPPMDGPWSFSVEIDNTVLAFTLAVSLAAGLLFGLAPALQATKPDTVSAVKGEGGRPGRSRMSSWLVILQMALSLLLLVSSGLFLRSLQRATHIDPGFEEPSNLVLTSIDPALQGYDEARSRSFLDRVLEEVSALPQTSAVGLTSWLPMGLNNSDRGVAVPGYEFAEGERRSINFALVSEGFVEALGTRLVEGRSFTPQDDENGPPVIVVNERFAERFWPGETAVGKVVRTVGTDHEVVGVIENVKVRSLGEPPTELMLLPLRQRFQASVSIVARTPNDPQTVFRRIREIVMAADAQVPLFDVRTMEDHMGVALLPARLGGSVLGLFGLLGLLLAAVGIYGVMAYSVSQRTKELGVRVALGADRRDVVGLVLREGMRLAVIGALLGVAGAAGAAQLVKGLLYGVSAYDPVAFGAVPSVLLLVAALAVYLPARRASRVEPVRALRTE